MPIYYLAIALTIGANVAYHLCSKKVEHGIHPLLSLAVTYLTALAVCLILIPLTGLEGGWKEQVSRLNWASFALGGAVVALEVGFILAYRAGWNISLAALYSNVAVGIGLLPVGIWYFGEKISPPQIVGLVFSFVGLVLLSK